jgi:hypothetical protein
MFGYKRSFSALSIVLLLLAVTAVPVLRAQDKPAPKVDTEKLYKDIAADYSFAIGPEPMVIAFWLQNGKLYGAPRGQENEMAEILPRDLDKLMFEATVPGGQYFELTFLKDDAGKITKCKLVSQGMEVIGDRIK